MINKTKLKEVVYMKRKMRIFIILLLIIIIVIGACIIIFTRVNNENKTNKNNMAISENKVIDSLFAVKPNRFCLQQGRIGWLGCRIG